MVLADTETVAEIYKPEPQISLFRKALCCPLSRSACSFGKEPEEMQGGSAGLVCVMTYCCKIFTLFAFAGDSILNSVVIPDTSFQGVTLADTLKRGSAKGSNET